MKKSILLALPTVHGISSLIEENLKHCGFDVINISRNDRKQEEFQYPSFLSWLKVRFQRDILKNKEAKINFQSALLLKEVEKLFTEGKKVDYALFFLANFYSLQFLDYIRDKVNVRMVNYQWDGIDRFPAIYSRLAKFDKTFVFDYQDLGKDHTLLPTTSFYFDMDLSPLPCEFDFYFLGAHREDRAEMMLKFTNLAKEKGWNINFNLTLSEKDAHWKAIYPNNITFLSDKNPMGFRENLHLARRAKVLLDFVITEHNGLSLRVFEALGNDKKLITTNKEVKKYDFYHSNNIFVLDETNFFEIASFLEKPYIYIDEKVKQKYSFTNWIHYVLDIPPYQPILLPNSNSL